MASLVKCAGVCERWGYKRPLNSQPQRQGVILPIGSREQEASRGPRRNTGENLRLFRAQIIIVVCRAAGAGVAGHQMNFSVPSPEFFGRRPSFVEHGGALDLQFVPRLARVQVDFDDFPIGRDGRSFVQGSGPSAGVLTPR